MSATTSPLSEFDLIHDAKRMSDFGPAGTPIGRQRKRNHSNNASAREAETSKKRKLWRGKPRVQNPPGYKSDKALAEEAKQLAIWNAKLSQRTQTPTQPQHWFPMAWNPSQRPAGLVDLTVGRLTAISRRTDRPVPLVPDNSKALPRGLLQRQTLEFRAPPIGLFGLRNNQSIESAIMHRYVALRPYFTELMEARPMDSSLSATDADWMRLFKAVVDDAARKDDRVFYFPKRTAWWAAKVGVTRLLEPKPTVVAVELPSTHSVINALFNTSVDNQQRDRDSHSVVPDRVHYRFVVEVPTGHRPLAPERRRAWYQPNGWYHKGPGQRRKLTEYTLWIEMDCEHDEAHSGVYEFYRATANTSSQLLSRKDGKEVWVEYATGQLFVLKHYADSECDNASGERMFDKPLVYYERISGKLMEVNKRGFGKREHVRVWHHFDPDMPLELAHDALGEIGAETAPTKYHLSAEVGAAIMRSGVLKLQPPRSPPFLPTHVQPEPVDDIVEIPKHKETGELGTLHGRTMRDIFDDLGLARDLTWDGHVLPQWATSSDKNEDYVWINDDRIKQDIAAQASVEHWRATVIATKSKLCELFPDHPQLRRSNAERHDMMCAIWGGTGLTSSAADPLTSDNLACRTRSLRAFHRLLQTWPTTGLNPWPQDAETDEATLERIENNIWLEFSQVYADFFRAAPPVLCPRRR